MNNNIIIYQSADNELSLNVKFDNETVWLTQQQMVELFDTTKPNISMHIRNIFKEKELDKNSVVKDFLTTASDGKDYLTKHYNLDVIISVGYRVKSQRGTQFRIWASKVLKEYLLKGYVIYTNKNTEIARLKEDMLERFESLEKDVDVHDRQFDEFYEALSKIFNEINLLKNKSGNDNPRRRIGFKQQNENT